MGCRLIALSYFCNSFFQRFAEFPKRFLRDRSKLGDRKGSTGCSEYDVLTVFDVVSGDRNEEGRMFGKVR